MVRRWTLALTLVGILGGVSVGVAGHAGVSRTASSATRAPAHAADDGLLGLLAQLIEEIRTHMPIGG